MAVELNDRLVRRDGVQKLDSLYDVYANIVSNESDWLSALMDVPNYAIAYNEIRDGQITKMKKS